MKDLYYILGTAGNSTQAQINEAYHKLAQKFDPAGLEHDHFLQNHFREITEAYQVLSDPVKRQKYDTALRKSYQNRFYRFRLSYLNIAFTLAFLLFTGLFGWYVVRLITTEKTAPVAKAAPVVDELPLVVKHHRHKHSLKIKQIAAHESLLSADTEKVPAPQKPAPAAALPVQQATPAAAPAEPGYAAYLKADLNGPVYLHEEPDYMSEVVTVLPRHAQIRVLEKDRNFFHISYNGKSGYVPRGMVE